MVTMKIFTVILFITFTATCCKRVRLSCEQIRQFVDGHNTKRQMVARGLLPGQPAASNMKFMVWDEELAAKAAKWADRVELAHNPDRAVPSHRWDIIGENIYISKVYTPPGVTAKPKIEEALHSWFEEYTNYGFSPFTMEASNTGHYTQMVWANTTRIGCGISQKKTGEKWTDILFVCDYGPAGNFIDSKPYKASDRGGVLLCTDKEDCIKPYGVRCSK